MKELGFIASMTEGLQESWMWENRTSGLRGGSGSGRNSRLFLSLTGQNLNSHSVYSVCVPWLHLLSFKINSHLWLDFGVNQLFHHFLMAPEAGRRLA